MSREGAPFPWPAGSATGLGPMPGTDPARALAVVFGELPSLPFLPELPERGPGADPVGRTVAMLVDLPAETTAGGWRLASRPGRDLRRAAGLLEADLDALEAAAASYAGTFKIQLTGPWTLAASLELSRSVDPALADPGAVADLATSLAEGVAAHVARVRARIPAARLLVQLDEPALPAVLAGSVPTASGLSRVRAVDAGVATGTIRQLLAAAGELAVVSCVSPEPPFSVVRKTGASAITLDLNSLRREQEDEIGEVVEAGLGLLLAAIPVGPVVLTGPSGRGAPGGVAGAAGPDWPRRTAASVAGLWRRIGLPPDRIAGQVVITPSGALAGVSPPRAREVLAQCQEVARLLPELIEEGAR